MQVSNIVEYLKDLCRPSQLLALHRLKRSNEKIMKEIEVLPYTMKRCFELLKITSQSFYVVILHLDAELRNIMCIFCMVLRALDTIEDDTSIERNKRITMLERFTEYLDDPVWKFEESKDKHKVVLEEFPTISKEFRKLEDHYQQIIRRTCIKMGHGMVKHLDNSPQDISQWDEYCYYVAGLLGEKLAKIFVASNLEKPDIATDSKSSISMGLFLQKVNIIRDYLEDIEDGRQFWPASVWKKYADKLENFSKAENFELGLFCLNELVTNALQHVPDVIKNLNRLKNRSILHCCAIPQVLAIASLERCYNNRKVFTGVVKIRKSEAAYLITQANDFNNVKQIFYHYAIKIRNRIPESDPFAIKTMEQIEQILKICHIPGNHYMYKFIDLLCVKLSLMLVMIMLIIYGLIVFYFD